MKIDEFVNVDPKTLLDNDLIERYNLCLNYLSDQTEVIYMTSSEEQFVKTAQNEISAHPLNRYLERLQSELVQVRNYRPVSKKIVVSFKKVE